MIKLNGIVLDDDMSPTMFDVVIIKRRPTKWVWQVRDREGTILMHGWETTRRAAKYRGDRALFLAARAKDQPEAP